MLSSNKLAVPLSGPKVISNSISSLSISKPEIWISKVLSSSMLELREFTIGISFTDSISIYTKAGSE